MTEDKQGREAPNRLVPYNTGKVLIGSRYEPDRKYQMSRDAEIIQAAFLGHRRYLIKTSKMSIAVWVIFAVAMVLWVTR
jgi:hypothetical protein